MSQKVVPIVIDMQKDFCAQDFHFDSPENDLREVREAVRRTGKFLEGFEGRTVTVRTVHGEEYDTEPWDRKYGESKPCEEGTEGEELMPPINRNTDVVVTKNGFNGFQGTNLNNVLKSLGAEKVALGGVMTNVCVEYTAQAAFNHGYEVVIMEDLTASAYEGAKEQSLRKVENIFAEVSESEKVLNQQL